MSSLVEWNSLVLLVKFQRKGLPRFLCHGFYVTEKPLEIVFPRLFVSHRSLLFVCSLACHLSRTNHLFSLFTPTTSRPSSLVVMSMGSPPTPTADRPAMKVH